MILIPKAPGWAPYRIRKAWDDLRIERAIRRLDRTRPMPANPDPNTADAELHMLLCRPHVRLGVLAIKSLLRFAENRFAVTITSDGSVSGDQREWINSHIPGCQWLNRVESDPRLEKLSQFPKLTALYKGSFHFIRKLIHPVLLGRAAKVIALDADTAFFKRPEKFLEWCQGDGQRAIFLHDHQDEATAVPRETRAAFAQLQKILAPAGDPWCMPYYFFNAGLLGFRPEQCNLAIAEHYLEWLETAPPQYTNGKPGLWFGSWTSEQTAYQLMFACMQRAATPLGNDYRIGNRAGFTFNHFLGLQLILPQSLDMLTRVVKELPQ